MQIDELYEKLPTGWLSREEAELLLKYASQTEGDIVEFGSYKGRSTVLLASLGRKVHAVDAFVGFDTDDPHGFEVRNDFIENTKGLDILLHEMDILDWIARPAGFVYCDGDHSFWGTTYQIKKAKECNPKYVAIDDYNDTGGGFWVKFAAKGLLSEPIERIGKIAIFKCA